MLMPFSAIKQSRADKKAGPYNITPQIDEQEVLRINNILKNTTTSEYEGYKKIADGAEKATNATDAYIASCIKMDKQASQADYATFAMQTMSQRAYTKQGVKDILRQYDELDTAVTSARNKFEEDGGEQALAALEAQIAAIKEATAAIFIEVFTTKLQSVRSVSSVFCFFRKQLSVLKRRYRQTKKQLLNFGVQL